MSNSRKLAKKRNTKMMSYMDFKKDSFAKMPNDMERWTVYIMGNNSLY